MSVAPGTDQPETSAAPPSPSPDPPNEPPREVKSPYPPAASTPVLIGPEGIRFDFNLGCRVSPAAARRRQMARAAARSRHRQHPVREREQGRLRQLRQALVCSLPRRGLVDRGRRDRGTDAGHDPRLRPAPSGRADPVSRSARWATSSPGFPMPRASPRCIRQCRVTCALSGLIIPLLRDAYPRSAPRHPRGT